MAAFATSTEMVEFYDVRTLGDLCGDDGDRVAEVDLATDEKMLAALEAATGKLLAAVRQGEMYQRSDLEALEDESLKYLEFLICKIAYWILWSRRTWSDRYEAIMKEARTEHNETLELFRTGQNVFDIVVNTEAGLPNVETITTTSAKEWDLVRDHCVGHYLPNRRYKGRIS